MVRELRYKIQLLFSLFVLLAMMAGMIEMLKLCVECLDLVQLVQLLSQAPPMDQCLPISSWMMSTAMGQKKLFKIALTTQDTIVEAVRELGSFVKLRHTFKQLQQQLQLQQQVFLLLQ